MKHFVLASTGRFKGYEYILINQILFACGTPAMYLPLTVIYNELMMSKNLVIWLHLNDKFVLLTFIKLEWKLLYFYLQEHITRSSSRPNSVYYIFESYQAKYSDWLMLNKIAVVIFPYISSKVMLQGSLVLGINITMIGHFTLHFSSSLMISTILKVDFDDGVNM